MKPVRLEEITQRPADTRLIIIGDASMGPEELTYPRGAISLGVDDAQPSMYWLKRLADRFTYSCWLNPIPREEWTGAYGRHSRDIIREIFHMEDTTLRGIKSMAAHLTKHEE